MSSAKIVLVEDFSDEEQAWNDKNWTQFDQETHDENSDNSAWIKKEVKIVARDGDEIVGTLYGHGKAGVMRIAELIVSKNHRGKGIGEAIMTEAEEKITEMGFHKADLYTNADLPAVKFYEKLGYKVEITLKNHFQGETYVLMSKLLN